MSAVASQITSLKIVYSTVLSGADQRKHQRTASLAFVRGIHRWPVNSPHKGPVTRKMLPFDDVIVWRCNLRLEHSSSHVVVHKTEVIYQFWQILLTKIIHIITNTIFKFWWNHPSITQVSGIVLHHLSISMLFLIKFLDQAFCMLPFCLKRKSWCCCFSTFFSNLLQVFL